MRKTLLVAGLAGWLLVPTRASAAVTVVFQRGSNPPSTMTVDGDHMRIDNPERSERATAILIDAAGKRIVMLDDKNKTYTEMTDEDRKRIHAQMDAMRAQMQERMKNLTPDQRKKMEEMMGPGAPGGERKPHEWKFEAMGQKKSVNGFACEMYRVSEDARPHEEDCVSPWSAGLLKKSDFAALAKFGEEMLADMGGGGADQRAAGGVFARIDKAPGIPISRVPIHADGKPALDEEEQIKSVKRGAVPGSLFAVPAGFAKKELPLGMGAGGARHHGGPPSP